MKKIAGCFADLVGVTPMMRPANYLKFVSASNANVFVKLEYLNPAGSVKDRVALYMIERAEANGVLKKGGVVIEPTSGNTGIGIAAVAASKGYRVILTLPENMSAERRKLLSLYGAELVLTPAEQGMTGAIAKADELKNSIEGAIILGQFDNPDNANAHKHSTAPEIWEALSGKIDIFVSAVGTGGTITGCGEYFKKRNPHIRIVAVEPAASPVLSGGAVGSHAIQGIGAGFVPKTLNREIIDEVVCVSDGDAFRQAVLFARCEGVLVGISSGAALQAALQVAGRSENRGLNIVAILPDSGDRYLSLDRFSGADFFDDPD